MIKYSWIDLNDCTKTLTNTPYLERRNWFNSLFKLNKKTITLTVPYSRSLEMISLTALKLPLKLDKTFSIGFKQQSKDTSVIWLVTPLTVLRFYMPIILREFASTKLCPSSETEQAVSLWMFPRYSQQRPQLWSSWVRTRTILSTALTFSLFSFVVSFSIVGYNYSVQYHANTLVFTLGYSHTNVVKLPKGILVQTTSKRSLNLYGANKFILTNFVSKLAKLKKPNIFTGKGLFCDSKPFKIKKRG